MRRLGLALAIAALAGFAAGCGDDDDKDSQPAPGPSGETVSADEFAQKTKPICERARDAEETFGESLREAKTPEEALAVYNRYGDSLTEARDELSAVGAPEDKRASYESMVEVLGEEAEATQETSKAIEAEDEAAFDELVKKLEGLGRRAATAAEDLGFTC